MPICCPIAGWKAAWLISDTECCGRVRPLCLIAPASGAEELPGARALTAPDLVEFGEPPDGGTEAVAFSTDQAVGPWLPD